MEFTAVETPVVASLILFGWKFTATSIPSNAPPLAISGFCLLYTSERKFTAEDFEITKVDSSGYVIKIRIGGNIYSGEKFREALDLPSGCFMLQDQEGSLKITTKGVGHGVGTVSYTHLVRAAVPGRLYF